MELKINVQRKPGRKPTNMTPAAIARRARYANDKQYRDECILSSSVWNKTHREQYTRNVCEWMAANPESTKITRELAKLHGKKAIAKEGAIVFIEGGKIVIEAAVLSR